MASLSSDKGRDFGFPPRGARKLTGTVSRTECWALGTTEFPSGVEEFSLFGHLGGAGDDSAGQVLFRQGGRPVWNAPPRQAPPKLPLECSLEGLGWESTSGEAARCLLTCVTGGRGSYEETFLIDERRTRRHNREQLVGQPGRARSTRGLC